MSGSINLPDVLPSRRSQRGGKQMESMLLRILSRMLQAIEETSRAAASPFRFILQTLDGGKPFLMVVLILHVWHTLRLQESHQLVLANLEFLLRIDITVAEIHRRLHTITKHTLHDGRRTRGTAGMQQHRLTIGLASIRERKFHEFILFFYWNLHFYFEL